MIGPTDLFHPSPAPQFKTFQVDMRRKYNAYGICEKCNSRKLAGRKVS